MMLEEFLGTIDRAHAKAFEFGSAAPVKEYGDGRAKLSRAS